MIGTVYFLAGHMFKCDCSHLQETVTEGEGLVLHRRLGLDNTGFQVSVEGEIQEKKTCVATCQSKTRDLKRDDTIPELGGFALVPPGWRLQAQPYLEEDHSWNRPFSPQNSLRCNFDHLPCSSVKLPEPWTGSQYAALVLSWSILATRQSLMPAGVRCKTAARRCMPRGLLSLLGPL